MVAFFIVSCDGCRKGMAMTTLKAKDKKSPIYSDRARKAPLKEETECLALVQTVVPRRQPLQRLCTHLYRWTRLGISKSLFLTFYFQRKASCARRLLGALALARGLDRVVGCRSGFHRY